MKELPMDIWKEYKKGDSYLYKNNLYQIVQTNEQFFDGEQWKDISVSNMPKPVINVLQRVVKYLIATLGTNDVAISMTPFSPVAEDIERITPITDEIEHIIEQAKIKEASRRAIRNAAVDGSAYMLQVFNADAETGQQIKGRIENKLIDNTQVFFGNPYSNEIQTQPYIIIALRQYVDQVKEEAKDLGVGKSEVEKIVADNEQTQTNDDSTDLITVLMKFYKKKSVVVEEVEETDLEGNVVVKQVKKEKKTVWFTKTTKDVTLIKPTDLGYTRYPIACFGWDERKNSYLYTSPLTAVIPNQIFINKCYAIAMQYGQQSAFPKIVYDKSKVDIQEFMNSTSPHAVANIDMLGKFLDFVKVPDFSNNILALVQDIMQQTKECMGVNDAALGNVEPDNTSAIVALQESAATPLEIQKSQFYEMWEDVVRNIVDMMSCTYGTRQVMTSDNELVLVNFDVLKELNFNLKVDIGNGAQFSEIAQINTMDKLLQAGIITPKSYVEAIPQKYILNKGKILQELTQQEQMQAQMMPPTAM